MNVKQVKSLIFLRDWRKSIDLYFQTKYGRDFHLDFHRFTIDYEDKKPSLIVCAIFTTKDNMPFTYHLADEIARSFVKVNLSKPTINIWSSKESCSFVSTLDLDSLPEGNDDSTSFEESLSKFMKSLD